MAMASPWWKRLFISANVGISLIAIQDQIIGFSRIKTDALEPDLPKGSIVLVKKSFDKMERGDVVLLSDAKTRVVSPKRVVGISRDWIKLRTNAFSIQKIPDGYAWFEDSHNFEMAHKPQDFLEIKSLVKGKVIFVLFPFKYFGDIKNVVKDDPLLNIGQITFDFQF